MPGQPTIEAKSYPEARASRVLLDALRGRGGKLTRADAMTLSGLPEAETDKALTVLLKEYRSHLTATESGELVYEFDPKLERRTAISWRERLARVGGALWAGFRFLFKISIVATLIVYFVLFVVMLLAVIFARRGDDDRDDRGGFGLDGLFWIWGFGPNPGVGYGGGRARGLPPRKPLYKSVFDFVFGPPAPKADALADEKEILAAIRQRKGRIAAVDLVELMGWDFEQAEQEATRLLADYGGEPEVTEDGVVLYVFKDLRKTAGDERAGVRPRAAWERMERAPALTGNESSTNAWIGFFNGFNLLAPFWIVPMFEMKTHVVLDGPAAQFLTQTFPVVFSCLFFAIPLARRVREPLRARAREQRNARRGLLGRIFGGDGSPKAAEALAPDPALRAALDRDLVALGGDVSPDDGRVRYVFPRIERERAAVARARREAAGSEADPGAAVFSSAD